MLSKFSDQVAAAAAKREPSDISETHQSMVENTIPQDFDLQINEASPIEHLNDKDYLQTELITTTNSKKLQP